MPQISSRLPSSHPFTDWSDCAVFPVLIITPSPSHSASVNCTAIRLCLCCVGQAVHLSLSLTVRLHTTYSKASTHSNRQESASALSLQLSTPKQSTEFGTTTPSYSLTVAISGATASDERYVPKMRKFCNSLGCGFLTFPRQIPPSSQSGCVVRRPKRREELESAVRKSFWKMEAQLKVEYSAEDGEWRERRALDHFAN